MPDGQHTRRVLPRPRGGRYLHFGDALRHYRDTVSDRLNRPDLPTMQVTAAALIKCVRETSGLDISTGSLSEIENGFTLPRNPMPFLEAVAPCLAIKKGTLEWLTLKRYLAHGILTQKINEAFANDTIVASEKELKIEIQSAIDNGRNPEDI
jgi:hypothetical protein